MSKIEWTGETWNPIVGCSRISDGCTHCYAEVMTKRQQAMGTPKYQGLLNDQGRFNGVLNFDEKALLKPLQKKKPTTYFVNSMSDLFHENAKDEWIDQVFAVMALCPQHTFQILTKRPDRMREYFDNKQTAFRISKAKDELEVQIEIAKSKMELRPVPNHPNYHISNFGIVYSANGSQNCLFCGQIIDGIASKKYCSKKCGQASHYQRSQGNPDKFFQTLVAMVPDISDDGYQRVMLYTDGVSKRELVHRLVLSTFDRSPHDNEQGCHKNGNPAQNHIANLRWGTQSDNWEDRKRHGNGLSYSKLTDADIQNIRESDLHDEDVACQFKISSTQVRNIRQHTQWNIEPEISLPLPQVWLGVSVENQEQADKRIPLLLETPAAVRFLSCEPLLDEVDLTRLNETMFLNGQDALAGKRDFSTFSHPKHTNKIDWVIVGGESGHGARVCREEWIRSIKEQCVAADVPVFIKQMGANVTYKGVKQTTYKNKKGGDIDEFPTDLRIRQMPKQFSAR